MIDKAATGLHRPAMSQTSLALVLAGLLVIAAVVGHGAAPYLFKRATLLSEISTQVRATTGLAVSTRHARFDLLPRPHVTMSGVHVSDPSGTFELDAAALDGDVRILPLIVGRIELSSATLMKPQLSINLDGPPMEPDSTIGRAMHAVEAPKNGPEQRLGSVTLVDGAATLTGKSLPRPLSLSDLDVTVDWRDLDSPATFTGSLRIQNTAADIAAWVARPSSLMRGDHSAIALRIHSVPLDLSANGDLASAASWIFRGHVSTTAPSLAALVELGSPKLSLPAPLAKLKMDGDAKVEAASGDVAAIDLQNLRLRVDGNDYEGTLAYQGGARPLVTGTLATERLLLDPFLAHAPPFVDASHRWTQVGLAPLRVEPVDIDLRISATHLRLARLTLDDAAFSVMSHGDRTEIALNEAKAYGGAIKGRVSLGFGPQGLNVRGAGTVRGADAATLSWDALGRQVATGTLSGSASLDSTGGSPAALMSHLQGWAKLGASDGEFSGVDLGRGLRAAASHEPINAILPALQSGHTPFATFEMGLQFADGIATIDEASMQGSGTMLTLTGNADVGARLLDLHASVRPPNANAGADVHAGVLAGALGSPPLRFDVKGSFNEFGVTPASGTEKVSTP